MFLDVSVLVSIVQMNRTNIPYNKKRSITVNWFTQLLRLKTHKMCTQKLETQEG